MLAPVVRGRKGEYEGLLKELASQGFTRARVDGELVELGAATSERLARYEMHTIEVVVDRLVRRPGIERRLTDSLETALRLAEGVAEVEIVPRDDDPDDLETLMFSEHLACTHCGVSFDELAPRNFSFNSPYGACERCDGLGTRFEVDPELLVPDDDLSLRDGAIAPWSGFRSHYFERVLDSVADEFGFSTDTPWKKLKKKEKQVVLYGTGKTSVKVSYRNRYGRQRSYTTQFEGVVPWLERRHTESESDRAREQIEGYIREVPCQACGGARLRPASLAVTIGGQNIYEVGELSIRKASEFLGSLELSERDRMIAERVEKEVNERLRFLLDVGLDYLSLNRSVGDAGRGRGATHPAGVADRQRTGRRALRARRAVDRPPPARQPAPDRHDGAAARPRQHRDRRRARRGDHPHRRPHRRHRPGRGGARRRDRRRGLAEEAARQQAVDHRAVPLGQAIDRGARDAAGTGRVRGSPCATRTSTTCSTSTSTSRSAASSRSPG